MLKNKIIGFLLALYPVLCIYASPFLIGSLGLLIMYLVITPLLLADVKKTIFCDKTVSSYLLFLLYTILITIVWKGLGGNDFISYIINGFVIIMLLHERGYLCYFVRLYVFLAFVFSIFLIIQFVAFYVFKNPINGILTFLPTVLQESSSMRVYDYMYVARISSVFLEPSHFALYVIPALVIVVWDLGIVVKRKLLFIVIAILAILMSTSGNGMVLLFIVGILYYFEKANKRKFIIATLVASIVVVGGIYLASNSEIISYTADALLSSNGYDENSKSYYRVERGFELYADLPLQTEVFGVGFRNAESACREYYHDVLKKYSIGYVNFEYFNTVAAILIYFGIIGFSLIFSFFATVWKQTSKLGEKAMIIVMVASCLSSSIFNTETWFIYISIISIILHRKLFEKCAVINKTYK